MLVTCAVSLTFPFCTTPNTCALSAEDQATIRSIASQYAASWEQDDTTGVLALFAEDAMIFPSGLEPLHGKEALAAFWWPGDGSVTVVHAYHIEVEEVDGCVDHAYSLERGVLDFSYTHGELDMRKTSRSQAVTTYHRQEDGQWKITRRIWTDLR